MLYRYGYHNEALMHRLMSAYTSVEEEEDKGTF